jgi:hypothetical protein
MGLFQRIKSSNVKSPTSKRFNVQEQGAFSTCLAPVNTTMGWSLILRAGESASVRDKHC